MISFLFQDGSRAPPKGSQASIQESSALFLPQGAEIGKMKFFSKKMWVGLEIFGKLNTKDEEPLIGSIISANLDKQHRE